MTLAPHDSARLRRIGLALLRSLTGFVTFTLLHGNHDDAIIYPINALTQF
jgi:hypothetical protein